jgi:hypothetical protein
MYLERYKITDEHYDPEGKKTFYPELYNRILDAVDAGASLEDACKANNTTVERFNDYIEDWKRIREEERKRGIIRR